MNSKGLDNQDPASQFIVSCYTRKWCNAVPTDPWKQGAGIIEILTKGIAFNFPLLFP